MQLRNDPVPSQPIAVSDSAAASTNPVATSPKPTPPPPSPPQNVATSSGKTAAPNVTGPASVPVSAAAPVNGNAASASSAEEKPQPQPNAASLASFVRKVNDGYGMIKTKDGKAYWNVTVTQVTPTSITFSHDNGVLTLPFDVFGDAPPPDLKKIYGYDSALAAAYSKAQDGYDLSETEKNVKESEAEEKKAREKEFIAENEVQVSGEIISVLPDGLLLNDGTRIFVLLNVNTANAVDGQRVTMRALKSGPYQYTNALGAQATVRAYIGLSKDD